MLVKVDKPSGGPSHLSYSEPIGICYIAAFLEDRGFECRLCHLFQENAEEALRQEITAYRPDCVAFSVRNFNIGSSRQCIAMIRREFPGVLVAIGGEAVTLQHLHEVTRFVDADVFIVGDGEEPLLAYVSGRDPASIAGVAHRDKHGHWQPPSVAARRIPAANLPMMTRKGLPMRHYCSEGFPGMRYATMHTLRGCRYHCTFCHTAGRYPEPDSRTVNQVLAELDYLVHHHGIESLVIWDEDFFASPRRVEAIAQGLVDRGSPVKWHSFMKLTDLRRQQVQALLPLLRQSGYIRAVVGLESYLPSTLRGYHKAGGTNAEELCAQLTYNGILLCPSYIIGAPHETCDDITYGLNRLLRLRDDHGILMDLPFLQFITPYPGTVLYNEYNAQGLIVDPDWSHYDGEHVVIRSRCPADKLLELRDAFYADFYGQPSRRGEPAI